MDQYDSLLKGWIFGSASENVLGAVVDLISAKDVWDKLKSFYDATVSPQQDPAATKLEAKTDTKDIDVGTAEAKPNVKDTITIDVETNDNTETKTEILNKNELEELHKATVKGHCFGVRAN
ncbi:hypothetical protein L2E82_39059 [Cichorium intybus]|uniref:Uncharacterized protein n=1 Tax=Cichorium intybus TaxID=13427 RepID=A0ACB9AI54_CICIN|nr:hypothetical protein L2E82_39059 [Cichorium intybus]